jgi:hypothetical protein
MTQENASEAAGPRYEVRDANVRRLLQFGASLCVVIALALFGMAKLMAYLTARQPGGPPIPPFATTQHLPPSPRLQITPRLDLVQKREAENTVLNSYAWIERPNGTVRIPIDRAMDLIAARLQTSRKLATDVQHDQAATPTRRGKE